MCEKLSELRSGIQRYARDFDAALLSASLAAQAVEHASAIEKIAGTVKALAAARLAETTVWKSSGDQSAAHHLARTTGTSVSDARKALETAERMQNQPTVREAASRGELSAEQAAAISAAGADAPGSEEALVAQAGRLSLQELREKCATARAASGGVDLEERRRRIHRRRFLRTWTDAEGGWNLACRDNPEVGAEIMATLDQLRNDRFNDARRAGRREPYEAHAMDALADMARLAGEALSGDIEDGDETHRDDSETELAGVRRRRRRRRREPGRFASTNAKVIVRTDIGPLLRGYPVEGEVCEIVGFGPVPVSVVKDLIASGNPFLAAVATDGTDIRSVVHLGRRPTALQQTALEWLYPTCAVEGCSARARLEYEHREDFARTHHTVLDELDRVCDPHHDMKTRLRWGLVDGVGKRAFVAPDDPRHPRNRGDPVHEGAA
jgi:hypothetical protein